MADGAFNQGHDDNQGVNVHVSMQTMETALTNLVRVVATTQQTLSTIATDASQDYTGVTPKYYESAATTNSTNVTAAATTLYTLSVVNSTATRYYLKLYNKATAPTVGTDTPVQIFDIPASTSSQIQLVKPLRFSLGLGFGITGAIAISDTTAAVTGIGINLGYN